MDLSHLTREEITILREKQKLMRKIASDVQDKIVYNLKKEIDSGSIILEDSTSSIILSTIEYSVNQVWNQIDKLDK